MVRGVVAMGWLLALSACGEPLIPETNVDQAVNEAVAEDAPELPPLEPVTAADFQGRLEPGAGCDLSIDGELLLVVALDGGGVAKWRGAIVPMRHVGGEVSRAGRFVGAEGAPIVDIETPEGEGEPAGDDVTSWRVAARLSSPDSDAEPKPFAAIWSCGA